VESDSSASVWNDLRLAGGSFLAAGVRLRALAATMTSILGCASLMASAHVLGARRRGLRILGAVLALALILAGAVVWMHAGPDPNLPRHVFRL
jgi:hypothetical protein